MKKEPPMTDKKLNTHLRVIRKLIKEKRKLTKRLADIEQKLMINDSLFEFSINQLTKEHVRSGEL